MQRLEVSGAVRSIYGSLGVKRLNSTTDLLKLLQGCFCHSNSKGKSVPLQASSGPEGSRKLRFPDFMTTAQDGVKVVSPRHRPPLPPGNAPGNHFC